MKSRGGLIERFPADGNARPFECQHLVRFTKYQAINKLLNEDPVVVLESQPEGDLTSSPTFETRFKKVIKESPTITD